MEIARGQLLFIPDQASRDNTSHLEQGISKTSKVVRTLRLRVDSFVGDHDGQQRALVFAVRDVDALQRKLLPGRRMRHVI